MTDSWILTKCGIPPIYQKPCRYAHKHPIYKRVIDNLADNVFLTGCNGSGKSTLASSILLELIANGRSCYRADIYTFQEEYVSAGWKVPDKYFQCGTLFLDELGKDIATKTDLPLAIVERIVKLRVEHKKSTILASNLSIAGLQQRFGPSLVSLIVGHFKVVEMDQIDHRVQ